MVFLFCTPFRALKTKLCIKNCNRTEHELSEAFHFTDLPEAVLRNSSSLLLVFVVFEVLQSLLYSAAPSGLLEATEYTLTSAHFKSLNLNFQSSSYIHTYIYVCVCVCVCVFIYTGCPRRNVPDFGRVFLMLKYTDITQNTYIQS
jgi:hypothetical protein